MPAILPHLVFRGEIIDADIPPTSVTIQGVLPSLSLEFTLGSILDVEINNFTFSASGYLGVNGTIPDLNMAFSLSLSGSQAAVGVLEVAALKMAFAGSGNVGQTVSFDKSIAYAFTASGNVGNVGTMDLVFNRVRLASATAYISPIGDLALALNIEFSATGSSSVFKSMVLNLKNNALTEYLSYAFNSMCSFNGKLYGAASDGIYNLTGETDNKVDIAWRFRTGKLDLETDDVKKSMRYAWLGYKASGELILSVFDQDNNQYDYVVENVRETDGGIRVKVGKGIRSRYVELQLANISNETIALDKLRIFTEPTGKKR